MPKFSFLIILSVFFLQACSDDPTKIRNKDLIKKEVFTEILIDIHMMDAITNSPGYFRKYNQRDSLDLYSNIFEKHRISKADFDSTVAAYTRRPDLYKEIYDEVLLKLNMRLDKLLEAEKNKINDGLVDTLNSTEVL